MVDYLALCTSTGLLVELLGGFFLAAEAIGLDRIRSWRNAGRVPLHILGTHRTVEMIDRANNLGVRHMPAILVGIGSGLGSGIGCALALAIKTHLPGASKWALLSGLLMGGLVGAFALDGVALILNVSLRALDWIESRARQGTIGLIGFVVLALGILMQFAGSLSLVWHMKSTP